MGSEEAVKDCKEHLLLRQEEFMQDVEDKVVTAWFTIPAKIHNAMIGSGGNLIQSIMNDCGGVSIKFPPPESKSNKVRQIILTDLLPGFFVMNVHLPKLQR